AASTALGAALLLGHASGAVSAQTAGPRSGVVVVNTNLAFVHNAAAGTGIAPSSSRLLLTNNHVHRGAPPLHAPHPPDGRTFTAKVLGYSVLKDIALLQVQHPQNLHAAPLGNSSNTRIGQAVTAVGNAGGTGSLTVVTGHITGLGQTITVSDDEGGT